MRGKEINEVVAFTKAKINKADLPTIEGEIEALKKQSARYQNRREFQETPSITKIDAALPLGIVDSMSIEKEEILNLNYDAVQESSEDRLNEHINKHLEVQTGFEWIRRGQIHFKNEVCPFCGQDTKSVEALVRAYSEVFTSEFDEYIQLLIARINNLQEGLKKQLHDSHLSLRNETVNKLRKFIRYIPEISEDCLDGLVKKINSLHELEAEYQKEMVVWQVEISKETDNKKNNFGKSIDSSPISPAVYSSASNFSERLASIDNELNALLDIISEAKEGLSGSSADKIAEELQSIETKWQKYDDLRARIEQDDQCEKFNEQYNAIDIEKNDINQAIEKLESKQSEYLDKYFSRLNYWFDYFGSAGFTIKKTTNNQGDKKVYSLKVEYKGEEIDSVDLTRVFSESDKRNLALSLFMARIEKIKNKNDKVIVFDDPVVSFDDNRVKLTCKMLKDIAPKYRQVIVLTHYGSVLKQMYKSNTLANYVEVITKSTGSSIANMDIASFSMSTREKEYETIQKFIDGQSQADILKSLRPFLEGSIKDRYRKQLKDAGHHASTLSEIIKNLEDGKHIASTLARELTNLKDLLNPDHHPESGDENIEETKNLAKHIFKVVYETL